MRVAPATPRLASPHFPPAYQPHQSATSPSRIQRPQLGPRSLNVHAHRFSDRAGRPNRVRLVVQSLESREVPAALDLSFSGAERPANGAILRQVDSALTSGTQFQTFLKLQHTGVEQGYNSDARPVQFDEVRRTAVNHSLKLADIPTVTVSG